VVIDCEHQTETEVEARWAKVDAMEREDVPAGLMVCACCTAPALDERCTRCDGRLL